MAYTRIGILLTLLLLESIIGCSSSSPIDTEKTAAAFLASASTRMTPKLVYNESYAGLLKGIELAIVYSDHGDDFVGRLRNETTETFCNIDVEVSVDGQQHWFATSGDNENLERFAPRERATFSLSMPQLEFSTWRARVIGAPCDTQHRPTPTQAPVTAHSMEGPNHSRSERHEDGHNERDSHSDESDEESSPPIPLHQRHTGTRERLSYDVVYNDQRDAFEGHVTNISHRTVCRSRMEVHLTVEGGTVELGPTIPMHLTPGETIHFVLSSDSTAATSYRFHPEASRCR